MNVIEEEADLLVIYKNYIIYKEQRRKNDIK